MRAAFTPHFKRSYSKLPKGTREAFDKKLTLLMESSRYPSLRVKKYDESRNIWQARITDSYRFYFEIKKNLYIFHEIKTHKD